MLCYGLLLKYFFSNTTLEQSFNLFALFQILDMETYPSEIGIAIMSEYSALIVYELR